MVHKPRWRTLTYYCRQWHIYGGFIGFGFSLLAQLIFNINYNHVISFFYPIKKKKCLLYFHLLGYRISNIIILFVIDCLSIYNDNDFVEIKIWKVKITSQDINIKCDLATPKRSFLTLRRLKTYLRSIMNEGYLSIIFEI